MECDSQIVMGVGVLGIRLDRRAKPPFRRDLLSSLEVSHALDVLPASQHLASR
jgi:hypothetical protein